MGTLIDGELAQLPILLFLRQVVRRTQEPLQQPCPGEPPDRVDSLEEGLPIPSERPVRFRAKPIERHVHVHSAHIDQLGDAVVTQRMFSTSIRGIDAPRVVAETKQCTQWRLHRSSI